MSTNNAPSGAMPINACRQAAKFRVMDLTGKDNIQLAEEGKFRRNSHLGKDVYQVEITNLGKDLSECQNHAQSGDLLFFNDLNQQKPSKENPMPPVLVEKILTTRLGRFPNFIPSQAEFDGILEQNEDITGYPLYEARWKNKENSEDYISITLNPASEEIFNYVKKWSL